MFDSREMPGQILEVVRADAMQASRANLSAAIKGHFAALAYLSGSAQDAAVRMAPRLGVNQLVPVAQSLADGMVRHHLLTNVVKVEQLSDSFIFAFV